MQNIYKSINEIISYIKIINCNRDEDGEIARSAINPKDLNVMLREYDYNAYREKLRWF